MVSYTVYKFIHILGIFLLFAAMGGAAMQIAWRRSSAGTPRRRWVAILHGVALVLLLLGGFGMMARLGIHWPWPGWVTAKFVIWAVVGAAFALIRREKVSGGLLLTGVGVLGVLAAIFALWKPF